MFAKSKQNKKRFELCLQRAFFGEVFAATRGTGPTFLNPLCQLWPKYITPDRETQRFHMLQQLQPLQRPTTFIHRGGGASQLAKRNQESRTCAPSCGKHLTQKSHPRKKESKLRVLCVSFECKKAAGRPYDHFCG